MPKCLKLRHVEIICTDKGQQQQGEAQVANQHKEAPQFAASFLHLDLKLKLAY